MEDFGSLSAAARSSFEASFRYGSAAVLGSFSANAAASSTFWWNVMTVRRFHAAACSRNAVCNSARRRPRRASSDSPRTGGADLQDVDLEPGEDLALDRLRESELCEPRAVRALPVVGHGRDLQLLAFRALLRPGRGEDARGRGQVEPEVRRDAGVVVDRRPRSPAVPCASSTIARSKPSMRRLEVPRTGRPAHHAALPQGGKPSSRSRLSPSLPPTRRLVPGPRLAPQR